MLYPVSSTYNNRKKQAILCIIIITHLFDFFFNGTFSNICYSFHVGATELETPLINLPVADQLRKELMSTGHFQIMDQATDEREHSGEMQYPYLAKILLDYTGRNGQQHTIDVLPIMVGSIHKTHEEFYGKVLASFLARTSVFTVVSSDFCHWGKRFGYYPPHDKDYRSAAFGGNLTVPGEEIFAYISSLDRIGMVRYSVENFGMPIVSFAMIDKNICKSIHPV